MATITLENLPDELLIQIEQLAQKHHQSVNEQVIILLKQALQQPQSKIKFTISPETDPTWEERRKAVPQIIASIEHRRQQLPTDIEWLDSTALLREDRDR